MSTRSASRIGRIAGFVFVAAVIIGSGPGIWLVNTPRPVPLPGGLTLPPLYAWGLAWYAVEAVCIVLLARFTWRAPDEDDDVITDEAEER